MLVRMLLALALAGCASGAPLEPLRASMRVDPSEWTDGQLADIAGAVEAWQALAPGRVDLELVDDEPNVVRVELGPLSGHYYAERIQLEAGPRMRAVLMHEIGHALNLGHVDGHAVMAPSVDSVSDSFTALDLDECARAGACIRGTLAP